MCSLLGSRACRAGYLGCSVLAVCSQKPRRNGLVCVCVKPCYQGSLVYMSTVQGSVALASYHTQRSCGCKWEARPDQSCVPANSMIGMGTFKCSLWP